MAQVRQTNKISDFHQLCGLLLMLVVITNGGKAIIRIWFNFFLSVFQNIKLIPKKFPEMT